MTADASPLAPMLARLAGRSSLEREAGDALLALPHRIESHPAGRHLVRAGERATRCFVLLDGFAYRHKIVGNGSRQIVGFNVRGDLVDLQNSMLGHADENVQALTGITVAAIPADRIVVLIASYPELGRAVLKEALVEAAIFSEWIANVGRRDARTRMAHMLCEMAWRQRAAGLPGNGRFQQPMTQEQLGDALGLTSVHVNRTLKQLEVDRLISRRSRSVHVDDWDALMRAGDFTPSYLHLVETEPAAAPAPAQALRLA